ncbi:MAG TPA: FAD-binding protein [Gemmatimonadales bacterium]
MSPVIDTGQTSWENKHETYVQPVRRVLQAVNDPPTTGDPLQRYNRTTAALQALISRALSEEVRLRAFGGGWSFSGAPATDGYLLDTSPLNLWFRVRERSIHPDYAGDRAGLFFLQCGNSIAGLNRNLRPERRSLRTTGASNGQSIVGAMSTGTHGSAIDLGAVQDYVVGIHLIVAPDRHLWIERASSPVTTDGFAGLLGAELRREDELFNAALVSFGAFGLIHGVMIETDPIFLFEMHRVRRPLDAGLRRAVTTLEFAGAGLPGGDERPRHFDVVINPYDLDDGVYLTAMYQRPFRPDYPAPMPGGGLAPGDDALQLVGTVTDALPLLIPPVMKAAVRSQYRTTTTPIQGTTNDIFPTTTTRGRASGTAIAVPLDRALDTMELVLEINRSHGPFPCLVALRFVPATDALLGFTRFERTCIVDVDGTLSNRTRSFYSRIWQSLSTSDIPYAMHWGKLLGLSAAEVRRLYGGSVDRWLAVRRGLLAPPLRRAFSNRFLEELDLAS